MHSFPDLPVDVARYILEITAVHDRGSASHLVYVSKAVREWIDPILYHTVVLRDNYSLDLFMESCNHRCARDADFYARNVKVLCLQGDTTSAVVKCILLYCTGVEVLSVWFHWHVEEGFIPFPAYFIAYLNARRLSLSWCFGLSGCAIPNLTHLSLPHDRDVEDGRDWEGLFQSCPHLTHILLDIVGEHVEDWDEELLAEGTVSKFRAILNAAPPSFKALIFEVLETEDGSAADTSDDGMEEEYPGLPAIFGQAEGFDVAAANLVNAMSDKRFVFIVPNNRFSYVSGLVCYEYTHNPVLDWCYRVDGELDAYEMADRYLSTVEQ